MNHSASKFRVVLKGGTFTARMVPNGKVKFKCDIQKMFVFFVIFSTWLTTNPSSELSNHHFANQPVKPHGFDAENNWKYSNKVALLLK